MQAFFTVLVMATVVTSVVDYTKIIVVERQIQWQVLLAIALGILVSWAYGLNLMQLLGIETTVPMVSYVLTGILISRGSNWLHDFISQAQNFKSE